MTLCTASDTGQMTYSYPRVEESTSNELLALYLEVSLSRAHKAGGHYLCPG